MDNLTTAIVTIITVLFSAGAWRFYETKMKLKSVEKNTKKQTKICIEMILEKE